MLQITAELESLSSAQRESLAGFILSFPTASQIADDDDIVLIPPFTADTAEDIEAADAAAVFGAHLIPEAATEEVFCNKLIEKTDQFVAAPAPAGPALVPSPPTAASTTLDKSGLPWDERIHASSRATTADGNWRRKRGAEDALVAQVEAELKALMGLPSPVAAATIPPPPPSIPVAVVEDRQSYVQLLSVASAAINAKTLTNEQLSAAVVAVGVPSLPLLANRLDLVPQVMAAVRAIIG